MREVQRVHCKQEGECEEAHTPTLYWKQKMCRLRWIRVMPNMSPLYRQENQWGRRYDTETLHLEDVFGENQQKGGETPGKGDESL